MVEKISLFSKLFKLYGGNKPPLENYFTEIVVHLFNTSPHTLYAWLRRIKLIDNENEYSQPPKIIGQKSLEDRRRPDIQIELFSGPYRDLIFVESKIGMMGEYEQLQIYAEYLHAQSGMIRQKYLLYVVARSNDTKSKERVFERIPDTKVRFVPENWNTLQKVLQEQPKNLLFDEIITFMYEHGIGQSNKLTQEVERINLSGANLSGATLSGIDLSKADLRQVNLNGSNLSKVNLSNTKLGKADLKAANLLDVNFTGSDLSEADLREVDLSKFDLRETNLSASNLNRANLSGANLRGVNLGQADLSQADLSDADLQGTILHKANLQGTILSRVNLNGADLREANLREADLNEAKLSKIKLSFANLYRANLRGADLSRADLRFIDGRGVNLTEADLSGVYMPGADLRGANLSGAKLFEVNLQMLKYDSTTIWPEGFNLLTDTEIV